MLMSALVGVVAFGLTAAAQASDDGHVDGAGRTTLVCVPSLERAGAVLDSIEEDLKQHVSTDCQGDVPQVARDGFDPDWPQLTAVAERGPAGSVPEFYEVSIVVVERDSEHYRLAESAGFVIDSRFYCADDSCHPSGYEVYVTPEELGTRRVDELVALASGTPRDMCGEVTPEWMKIRGSCPGYGQ
jgi:hypothetical protein